MVVSHSSQPATIREQASDTLQCIHHTLCSVRCHYMVPQVKCMRQPKEHLRLSHPSSILPFLSALICFLTLCCLITKFPPIIDIVKVLAERKWATLLQGKLDFKTAVLESLSSRAGHFARQSSVRVSGSLPDSTLFLEYKGIFLRSRPLPYKENGLVFLQTRL